VHRTVVALRVFNPRNLQTDRSKHVSEYGATVGALLDQDTVKNEHR